MLIFFACQKPEPQEPSIYFPPNGSMEWERISAEELGWNVQFVPELEAMLDQGNSRAFILLKDGKIVFENYFGNNLAQTAPFGANTLWYWASAGKTLSAFTVGIAQQEGLLNIENPSSDYLGRWTSLTEQQERAIKVRHQLSMSTGLDDEVDNRDDTRPESLVYKAQPGQRWAYHNAPYTLLHQVVSSAAGQSFDTYFQSRLRDKIGMEGVWQQIGFNRVYFSTARSMARFGLLILAEGKWKEEAILTDEVFFRQMVETSQNLNPAYGYLWWLNGKAGFMAPQVQVVFPGSIHPQAPNDMISGIGRDGQYVSVVPSQGIVLVRMGLNPDQALVPFTFQNDIWRVLNKIIP